MEIVVSCLLLALASLLAIPVAVLALEILAAVVARPPKPLPRAKYVRPRIAVIVPAHNESANLLPTLTDIRRQLIPRDRMIVVADNCTDDTAELAAAAGAEVVVRNDPELVGKGYALDRGVAYLTPKPCDVVIMIDADCRLADGAIADLALTCARAQRPVQALYLMHAPPRARGHGAADFAWRIKNALRPLGLATLGLPCQLMGTGMAFPWSIIQAAELASGAIVEDLKLGLDLARAGTPPIFCPTALVTSTFPTSAKGAKTQRLRWEQGHVGMIAAAPRLIKQAIARRNFGLLALALDIAVPPLALLVLLTLATCALAGASVLFGLSAVPLMVSAASLATLVVAIVLAWLKCGHDVLPPRALFSLLTFVIGKLPLYGAALSRRNTPWVRTDRGSSH